MKRTNIWQRLPSLSRHDGTVAIEFAIVGLIFFALLLGSIELGRVMWMRSSLQFAAEETARWVLVRPKASTTEIEEFARTRLTSTPATATVAITFEPSSASRKYVVVTLTQVFTPVASLVATGNINVIGRTRMPIG
jgi:Flp pilus assembly protein TadG